MVEITPDDYIKMNEEFEREGTPIVLHPIPTQEEIDNPTGVKLPQLLNHNHPWTLTIHGHMVLERHTKKLMTSLTTTLTQMKILTLEDYQRW